MLSPLAYRAELFATHAHRDQKRKGNGKPYITHPARVAAHVERRGLGDVCVAAAWLHDTIEDCGVHYELLREVFGTPVADLVAELTNASAVTGVPRAERKRQDRVRLAQCSVAARRIKLIDRIDNLGEVAELEPKFVRMYCDESELLLEDLAGTEEVLEVELRKAISAARSALAPLPSDRETIAQLRATLNFFRSVIKSGESWSAQCQNEYDKAFGVLPSAAEPVPVEICCPNCGKRHIDEGEWATTHHHRTHLCAGCKHEWRPFEYATVGV